MKKSIILVPIFISLFTVQAIGQEIKPVGCSFIIKNVFKGSPGQFNEATYFWEQGFDFESRMGWGLKTEKTEDDGFESFVGLVNANQENVQLMVRVTDKKTHFTVHAQIIQDSDLRLVAESGSADLVIRDGQLPDIVSLSLENPFVREFKNSTGSEDNYIKAENFPLGTVIFESAEVSCAARRVRD